MPTDAAGAIRSVSLARHLADRHRGLMLARTREAEVAAGDGDRARQSLASTEAERHREAYSALMLVLAEVDRPERVQP